MITVVTGLIQLVYLGQFHEPALAEILLFFFLGFIVFFIILLEAFGRQSQLRDLHREDLVFLLDQFRRLHIKDRDLLKARPFPPRGG